MGGVDPVGRKLPPLPVGLDTDDLMLVLQDGGVLTLPMLWGLEIGDFITLKGLASGGVPIVLDSAGLQVLELARWVSTRPEPTGPRLAGLPSEGRLVLK